MKDWFDLLANANNSIVETWAIFITVNTATIGWILSKKTSFSKHHVLFAIIGYAAFTFSILLMLEEKHTYRNAILLDLQAQFIEEEKETTEYPFVVIEKGERVASNISKYISNKSASYKSEVYFWLFSSWFLISLVFYLDGKGQFHPNENEDNKANPADAKK